MSESWETNNRYSGMTVNERLYDAGVIEIWNGAIERRDRGTLIRLLQYVSLTQAAAEQVADAALARQNSDAG